MMGRRLLFASILALLARDAWAESPNLTRVMPRGAQRGTEVDVVLSGTQLKDAQEVFLYKPGIQVLKLEAGDNATVKLRLKIAADAPLGEHPLRLRTATGISDLRTFYVGRFAAIEEKEPNTKFTEPQKIGLNITVTGSIGNEDVDHFSVELKKGQRLTAELEGMRLGTSLFDAYIAFFDTKRFEIAASDDNALLLQDPMLSFVAPEDGTYIIMVREASYGGGDNGQYRLHVGTYPRPLAVYPPGGKAGEELAVTYLGDVKGPLARKIKLPATGEERLAVYVEEDGLFPPSPNYIRISDYPNALETEPNNTREQATATSLPLPVALNGIIQANGDEDWFKFAAKKGQAFDVKVCARAVRSPLDPVLFIYDGKGSQMVTNDDQGGPDAVARFSAPADGDYYIRVRDHLKKGGPAYVYRVEFTNPKASVYTHIPAYDREPRDQVRQWVVVPKGNRFATWMRVNRTGVNGDMKLAIDGLPEGITWKADPIPADQDRTLVVFECAADAKVAGKLVDVIAKSTDPAQKIEGGFRQDVNLVYGPPNNTVYYGTRVNKLAVAVSEPAPFRLKLVEPKVPIVQNGAMNLKVVAERNDGFTAPIELRLLWSPPGIGAQGTVTLPQGKNEVEYPINANGNAATKTWKIAVIGSAPGANGLAWVSTQLMPLTVAAPYIGMKIDMAAVELGKETKLVCKLEQLRPFEGKAKVSLGGLPPEVVAEPAEKEITKDDKEITFKVKTSPKSPAGQHKSLFGQIVVMEKGEPIVHSVAGGSVLRLDTPPVKKADAAKK